MKTLIELYDDSPIENVLATEMFRPEETVLICPPEAAGSKHLREGLTRYFRRREVPVKLTFVPVSLLDAGKIAQALTRVLGEKADCALDISGGTDATLFAAGAVAGDHPVFTYSRKNNTFYEIQNAPFARSLPCTVRLDAASCFLMAGGELKPGREDNRVLEDYLTRIDRAFEVYSAFRGVWNRQIACLQRVSSAAPGELTAEGPRMVKADRGRVPIDTDLLRALARAGLILDLEVEEDSFRFRFQDEVVRFWLRDMGSALELYVWKCCREAGCFDDVVLSAVVDWHSGVSALGEKRGDAVTNEIDVMAVQGIQPLFISCKTCEIHTEALNELAILRDRFGGKYARAMIVSSGPAPRSGSPVRRRAAELGIEVVDWQDLASGSLVSRLRREEEK
ncbi:MAG: DUF1887 family protein [Clostridia bacterium]|nr:DUF1887 family protein [Clostridia bacterium]